MLPDGLPARCFTGIGWDFRANVPEKLQPPLPSRFSTAYGQALAAPAGERERIHHHRTDLLLDVLAQHGARTVQPRLHGLGLDAEQIGGLLDVHPLHDARDEDHAEDIRQFIDCAFDDALDFTLGHGPFRIACGRNGKLDDLRVERLFRQRAELDMRLAASRPAKRLVDGNARQPGRQPGLAAKVVEMGKGPDIGFLHHVLGFAVAAQDTARETVEPAVVGLHDLAQRGLVTAPRAVDQFGFRCSGAGGQAGCGPLHGGHLFPFVPDIGCRPAIKVPDFLTLSPPAVTSNLEGRG